MKVIHIVAVLVSFFPGAVFAASECSVEAKAIADEAVRLFAVNDLSFHCEAIGKLVRFDQLEVQTELPVRFAYEAGFEFPCPPQPRTPVVTMVLSESCKIVELQMLGFR